MEGAGAGGVARYNRTVIGSHQSQIESPLCQKQRWAGAVGPNVGKARRQVHQPLAMEVSESAASLSGG